MSASDDPKYYRKLRQGYYNKLDGQIRQKNLERRRFSLNLLFFLRFIFRKNNEHNN